MWTRTNILRHPTPKLADVQCSRLQFQPGDRILVRCHRKLSDEEERKLRRSVERWAGNCVEVLVINALEVSVEVDHAKIVS